MRRSTWKRCLLAAFAALCAMAAARAEYPERPVRVIVPFPPGGGAEPIARMVGQKLTEALEEPQVKERLETIGMLPRPTTPEDCALLTRREIEKWAKAVRAARLRVD